MLKETGTAKGKGMAAMAHKRNGRAQRREAAAAACFLLPSVLGTALFVLAPFAETVRRSFTNALGTQGAGLANYRAVLGNAAFRLAAGNTARFLCVCVPLLLAVSFALALAVRPLAKGRAPRAARRLKTAFLLPMALPVASVALLWQALFARRGAVNGLLAALGAQEVDFMGTGAAFWVLVGTYVWKNAGYDMVLWLAGLGAVPDSLYEAAAVDGATRWQILRRITLPQLAPTLALTALLSLVNAFKAFREAYLVAGSYPHESIYLLQHLFNNWFASLDMGRLTAAAVLSALALLALALPLQRAMRGGGA